MKNSLKKLQGFQKSYLRGLAHGIKPVVIIGQKGITAAVVRSIDEALNSHELIKVKFVDFKEKPLKEKIADDIEKQTGCENVGVIGHTAIFYRQHADPQKQKIKVPQREL
ncbi:MAG: ribosome assembly RNA-binding protein YhbY [Pseudomonadota bacterium]